MSDDFQTRLRRLGVTRGARQLKPASPIEKPLPEPGQEPGHSGGRPYPPAEELRGIDQVMPAGRLEENEAGAFFVVDRVYPLIHRHGSRRLDELLRHDPGTAAWIAGDDRLAEIDPRRLLFLDTETTGLGGAGTLAFMVGAAYFERDALVVRQYFLRDHGDEPAMLRALRGLIAERPGVVSFNGRTFDLPLLDNRLFLNRVELTRGDLRDHPHLDLLPPSRRLWRWQWGSCSLGALEQNVLGVRRTQEDVPGSLIPWLYIQYLRDGDAEPLRRVFYHNQVDMLSMVTLAAELMTLVLRPDRSLRPLESLGLARWHLDRKAPAEAEAHLAAGLAASHSGADRSRLLDELAAFLKKQDRREEAVVYWEELAQEFDSIPAHVELAMVFEWHDSDLAQAQFWAEKAIALAEGSAAGRIQLPQLRHRLNRIRRKRGQID